MSKKKTNEPFFARYFVFDKDSCSLFSWL